LERRGEYTKIDGGCVEPAIQYRGASGDRGAFSRRKNMAAIHRRSVVVRGLAAASAAVEAEKHGCYTHAAYGDVVLHSLLLHSLTANSYAGCASLLNRGL